MRALALSRLDPLLRDLFPTTDELRRLASVIHPELVDVLPGEIASPEQLREVLLTQVECRGLLDDLLAALRRERPRMVERIDAFRPPPRRSPPRVAPKRSAAGPLLRGPRIVAVDPQDNDQVSLLRLLVELLTAVPGAGERNTPYVRRLTEIRASGLGPRPHLLLRGVPGALSLHAYPALMIGDDTSATARALPLTADGPLVALYCPFGYHQEGPKFRLSAHPSATGGSMITVDLLGEPGGASLEIHIQAAAIDPADPILTEGAQ